MKRVLLLGYFGAGNLGDDGLLVDWLLRFGPAMRQRGISADVVAGDQPLLSGFQEAPQLDTLVSGMVSKQRLVKLNPRSYLALIAPGGSLLQDATSLRSLLFYLYTIHRFTSAGRPVYLLNQGLGPLRSSFSRWITKKVLSKVSYLSLRDKFSYDWARRNLDLPLPWQTTLSADPLLAGRLEAQTHIGGNYAVLIPKAARGLIQRRMESRALHELLTDIRRMGLEPHIQAFHGGEDTALVRDLCSTSSSDFDQAPSADIFPHSALLGLLAGAKLTISYRLHGLILSAAYGVPAIGIAYDPKVAAFCEELSLPCTDTGLMQEGAVSYSARYLLESYTEVTERMLFKRDQILGRLFASEATFEEAWLG